VAKKTKQQILSDAREAKRLLDDPDLQRFFDEMQQQIFDDFRAVGLGDAGRLASVQARQHGLDAVRQRLVGYVEDGIVAEKTAR